MIFTIPIHEANDCHNPAGEGGGQFCSKDGPLPTLTNVRVIHPRGQIPAGDTRFFPGELGDSMWMVIADQGWMELSTPPHGYMGPHLLVFNVAINPTQRGEGYGQALYLQAAKAAKAIGKSTWPQYRGILSSPGLRSEAATRAWKALKRRFPKRVKQVPGGSAGLEVLEVPSQREEQQAKRRRT